MKEKFKNLYARIAVWLTKKPQTKATWIMVFVSCVMMWTLIQNQKVIIQNARTLQTTVESLELQKIATSNAIQQLQIEEETRKNPELECAYSYGHIVTNYGFVLRNVGNAPATNVYLRVSAACVTSNSVYTLEYCRVPIGNGMAPLVGKLMLTPGEQADVQDLYVPNIEWLQEVMIKYKGDILVRLYAEYERPAPNYRRYSGYFNFVFDRAIWGLQAAEGSPRVQQALERYNSISPSQRFEIWSPISRTRTNVWEVMDSIFGRDVAGMQSDNGSGSIKSLNWTKHN